jgi:hypothetical protein
VADNSRQPLPLLFFDWKPPHAAARVYCAIISMYSQGCLYLEYIHPVAALHSHYSPASRRHAAGSSPHDLSTTMALYITHTTNQTLLRLEDHTDTDASGRKLGDDDDGAYARACAQPGHACLEDWMIRLGVRMAGARRMQPKPHRLPLLICESARARLDKPKILTRLPQGYAWIFLELLMELLDD